MKKTLLMALTMVACMVASMAGAQPYSADWESLDTRPTAPWFEDAKFGVFIHWGPYSVPGWSPKGTYSEWYQYWLQTKKLSGAGDFKGDEVYNYHAKTYGEDFPYYNFGEQFTADLFDPDAWAELFVGAGAKYIVITSKHHDGYCLWPSKEANDRGFPWNSVDVGAKRDLLGDLTASVKRTEVKMGFYYSLYEWFHPWYAEETQRERFVDEHMLPQLRDLVNRYSPDILWADGQWEMDSDKWKTAPFLAWLFNESPVKGSVVVNDRWGRETRRKYGSYFTTEYDSQSFSRPWEECRGMGYSFGYNRNEDIEDYNSPQVLILLLASTVSKGGNLLLDIGPDGRGRIPVIMQERLLQMGKWLDANGEAIYGTRAWRVPEQWSAGNREEIKRGKSYLGGEYILKLTVNPDPGRAVKEAFFTCKEDTLYAITPKWPGKDLTLRGVAVESDCTVHLLATGEKLAWRQSGADLVIDLPAYDPGKFTAEQTYAYAFRITKVKETS